MDPRLRSAVDASIGWYEDLCTLHGVATTLREGLWSALAPPPPLHSDAVVVEPGVSADQIGQRLLTRASAGVKDSFATLDLSGLGMRELFAASWLAREPDPSPPAAPPGWSLVTGAGDLAEWAAGHDTTGVLLPPLLARARLAVLARRQGGRIVAGAVARLDAGVVEVSNAHAAPGSALDWAELVAAVGARFPGRRLVGYEHGEALDAARAVGFTATGPLRVWVR